MLTSICAQGDLGPFNPGLPVDVPVWLALNLKQRQKCRIVPPAWMDVGKLHSADMCLACFRLTLLFG